MADKSTSSNAPWREGRPSFKGYRVEFFLLILFTLVCFVCAIVWSCSVIKQERKESQSDSAAYVVPSSFAFAQDASIDELAESTEKTETESAPDANATSAPAVASNASSNKGASDYRIKLILIWSVCLILPLLLWIWRGWIWFSTIFGTRYELRCDADNPKATTFLITRGIFQKRTDSMHIGQITDIHSEQSLIQKYLLGGIGNVILHTKDTTDPLVKMKNMDEPGRVFNAFDELRRHYWGRGGVQLNQSEVDDFSDNADGGVGA